MRHSLFNALPTLSVWHSLLMLYQYILSVGYSKKVTSFAFSAICFIRVLWFGACITIYFRNMTKSPVWFDIMSKWKHSVLFSCFKVFIWPNQPRQGYHGNKTVESSRTTGQWVLVDTETWRYHGKGQFPWVAQAISRQSYARTYSLRWG